MAAIFAPALDKYTRTLLARIAVDYNLNEAELVAKYITNGAVVTLKKAPGPKKPRVPKEDRPPCPGLTGKKKTPCKNVCLPGDVACHFHSDKPKLPKVLTQALCQPCEPLLVQTDIDNLKNAAVGMEEAAKQLASQPVPEPEDESDSEPETNDSEMSLQDRLRMIIGEEEDE